MDVEHAAVAAGTSVSAFVVDLLVNTFAVNKPPMPATSDLAKALAMAETTHEPTATAAATTDKGEAASANTAGHAQGSAASASPRAGARSASGITGARAGRCAERGPRQLYEASADESSTAIRHFIAHANFADASAASNADGANTARANCNSGNGTTCLAAFSFGMGLSAS